MMIVHHLENSRSHRVLWLLQELGAEYQIKSYQRDKATTRAPVEAAITRPGLDAGRPDLMAFVDRIRHRFRLSAGR